MQIRNLFPVSQGGGKFMVITGAGAPIATNFPSLPHAWRWLIGPTYRWPRSAKAYEGSSHAATPRGRKVQERAKKPQRGTPHYGKRT